MADEKFLKFMAQQQELLAKQTEILNSAIQKLTLDSGKKSESEPSRVEKTMETLTKCMQDFQYDPENNIIFADWYARYSDLFEIDAANLDDAAKVRLLLRKLDTTAYARFTNYILPKLPRDYSFDETKLVLNKIFDRQMSLFNVRYNCLKVSKQSEDDFVSYAGKVNKQCEQFQLKELTNDQFKCLIFICGLNSNSDSDIRTKLLSIIETDKTVTLDKLTCETIRITSLKHDTKMVEGTSSSINQIAHQSITQINGKPSSSVNKIPKSVCWFCGGQHYVRFCTYKNHQCTKCQNIGHKEGFCQKTSKTEPKAKLPACKRRRRYQNKGPRANHILISKINYESHRKFITVKINNYPVKIQIDTGSDISIISQEVWQIIGKPATTTTIHSAKNASGDILQLTSQFDCNITLNTETITATCYVSNIKNLNLMGIDWIEAFGLWDVPISTLCNQIKNKTDNSFINRLRKQFPNVFNGNLGICTKAKAVLHLKPNAKPVFRPKRPVPYAALPAVEKEINRLEEMGVISRIDYSAWAAPIVATKKSNGDIRICGDFSTGLNNALESHNYPLPLPEDIFATLAGGQYFSKIDLADAYLQIMVDDESKKLLAINTHRGLYQYNRLCFGVKTAPSIFQQTIDTMLAGLSGTVSYLDDIIIVGKTEAEHRENVSNVFKKIQDWGFHIKADKCKFLLPRIKYLGFIIDKEGRRPDPDKTDAIAKMPPPTDLTTLRSFIGMVNYYGQFINRMRELRAPFDKLLVKDVKWSWSTECQRSFNEAKQVLQSDLLLTHFDPKNTIKVAADASSYGIGAVILHRFPDKSEKAIAHAARSLTKTEMNYSQIEKEALALIFAVTKFHRMIHGRKFILSTDHKPLLAVFGSKKGIPVHSANRLQRWAITLLAYDFDIEHISTTKFGHADVLSRLMSRNTPTAEDRVIASISMVEAEVNQIFTEAVRTLPVTCDMIVKETSEDKLLQQVAMYIKTSWPAAVTNGELKPFFNRRESLSEIKGCLLMSERIIIPSKFQKRVLNQLHTGHPGIVRMKSLARSYVYWPNIDVQIEDLVRQCSRCASEAKAPTKTKLSSWPITTKPWSRIHIDYAGPFEGHNFLVVVDAYSKWPEICIQTQTTAAATIAKLRELFSRFGSPETIVSDNGTQFTSHSFEHFCKINGIQHIRTPPFSPQCNGQAERFVDTFKRALRKSKGEALTHENLQTFLRCYRTTPNALLTNNATPAELMFGRKIRIPLDLLRPSTGFGSTLRNEPMEQNFNRQHGAIDRIFHPSNEVYIMDYSTTKRTWIPATILQRIGNVLYKVKSDKGITRRHANQIRKRTGEVKPSGQSSLIPFEMLVETFTVDVPEQPVVGNEPETSSSIQSNSTPSKRYPTRNRLPPKRLEFTHSSRGRYRSFYNNND